MEITLLVALCRATQLENSRVGVQPLTREGRSWESLVFIVFWHSFALFFFLVNKIGATWGLWLVILMQHDSNSSVWGLPGDAYETMSHYVYVMPRNRKYKIKSLFQILMIRIVSHWSATKCIRSGVAPTTHLLWNMANPLKLLQHKTWNISVWKSKCWCSTHFIGASSTEILFGDFDSENFDPQGSPVWSSHPKRWKWNLGLLDCQGFRFLSKSEEL